MISDFAPLGVPLRPESISHFGYSLRRGNEEIFRSYREWRRHWRLPRTSLRGSSRLSFRGSIEAAYGATTLRKKEVPHSSRLLLDIPLRAVIVNLSAR